MKNPLHIARDAFPLTPTQQGMLFHSLAAEDPSVYLQQFIWRLEEPLDRGSFGRAWDDAFARHEILRSSVERGGGLQARLRVHASVETPLEWIDWTSTPVGGREARLREALAADRAAGLDCACAPAMRMRVFVFGDASHCLVWTYHHAYLDGRSRAMIMDEVFQAYAAYGAGLTPELPPAPPFHGYPLWLAKQDEGPAAAFWRRLLADVESPTPLYQSADPGPLRIGVGHRETRTQIDAAETSRLQACAKSQGLTLNTLVQAAWALMLSRHSGERTVIFGATRSGRRVPGLDTERMAGLLINTLPVKTALPDELPLGDWLRQLRALWVAMRDHEHSSPVLFRESSALPPGSQLFESIVVLETSDLNESRHALGGPWLNRRFDLLQHTHYPLTLSLKAGESLHLALEAAPERYSAVAAGCILGHFIGLLRDLVRLDPATPLGAIGLPADEALQAVQQSWAAARRPLPRAPSFVALFEAAARRPQRIALLFQDQSMSYGELDAGANRIAHFLLGQGVGRGDLVACCLNRSPLMLQALLGILKTGAGYIPLDPVYPAERIAMILEDSGGPPVLTESALSGLFAQSAGCVTRLDQAEQALKGLPSSRPQTPPGPDDRAYAIFTSGSTGRPKGVEIGHRALLNFLHAMARRPGLDADDCVLAVTTVAFDIAALELFLPLICGARIRLASAREAADGDALLGRLQQGVTLLQATPVTWRLLLAAGWSDTPGLKMLCGGEAMPPDLARAMLARGAEVWNMYGPTETTVWSTCCRVTAEKIRAAGMPVGEPIDNTLVAVVDERQRPLPVGVAGELVIGGLGVADGYLGRPQLSAERFVPNPLPNTGGGRIYRTGDRAKFTEDGALIYLQRLDHQIKLRGFRIEPGEIEAALNSHAEVMQSVVTAHTNAAGDTVLAGYLQTADGVLSDEPALRRYLRRHIPDYMTPGVLIPLAELPKTPNGKIDRKALPDPGTVVRAAGAGRTPPRDTLELTLARIWQEVLEAPTLGIRDSFFDLGGHSLKAVALIGRIEKALGRHLPVSLLFRYPDIERLAGRLRCADDAAQHEQSLVSFRDAGERAPLFLIHPVGGNPLCYLQLCRLLGDDQPCYGLQMEHPLHAGEDSVQALAYSYVERIRRAHPIGPYRLAGWSFGGLVALEASRLLVAAGEPVEPPILIDTRLPQPDQSGDPVTAAAFVKDLVRVIGGEAPATRDTRQSGDADDLDALHRQILQQEWLPHVTRHQFQRMFEVYRANCEAMRRYWALPYPGDLRLVCAAAGAANPADWNDFIQGRLDLLTLEGDHYSLLKAPAVEPLATWMQARLQDPEN